MREERDEAIAQRDEVRAQVEDADMIAEHLALREPTSNISPEERARHRPPHAAGNAARPPEAPGGDGGEMALTRKMLRAMGIEDDKADQIIEAHAETVDALRPWIRVFLRSKQRVGQGIPRPNCIFMVGATGFEPATLCSQSRCATKLRYAPNSVQYRVVPLPLQRVTSCSRKQLPPCGYRSPTHERRSVTYTFLSCL